MFSVFTPKNVTAPPTVKKVLCEKTGTIYYANDTAWGWSLKEVTSKKINVDTHL